MLRHLRTALLKAVVLAVCLGTTGGASAATFYQKAGGWTVASDTDMCFALLTFEGPGSTELTFGKDVDGLVSLAIQNYQWSAKADELYEAGFQLNGKLYDGGQVVGVKSSGRNGFVARFPPAFEQDFAEGSSLRVELKGELIDQLSLSGTGAAVLAVNRCLAPIRAARAAQRREEARWAHLPKDPFAKPCVPPPSPAEPSQPPIVRRDDVDADLAIPLNRGGGPDLSAPRPSSDPQLTPTMPALSPAGSSGRNSANADIAAPLRAAQAAKATSSGGEEQFRKLFSSWQSISKQQAPLASVSEAAGLAARCIP